MAKSNFNSTQGYAGPQNPGGIKQPAAQAPAPGLYRGGLQTQFGNNAGTKKVRVNLPNGGSSEFTAPDYETSHSGDVDVDEVQRLTNESADVNNVGVDHRANDAKIAALRARIGIKNSLAEQIAGQNDLLAREKDQISATASDALSSGTKNTRQGFNGRGLLYSGLRERGEGDVRGAVAGQYAAGIAGAERDSYNSKNAAMSAYESVSLANQEQALNNSKQAFQTASANNIARLQAMQQLGQGVGYAAGSVAGYQNRKPVEGGNPAKNWNPEPITKPEVGSQYSTPYNYSFNTGNLKGDI